MNWKIKGAIQKTLSRMPGGMSCNHLLQRNLGQLKGDAHILHTFQYDIPVLFTQMARVGVDPASCRILEIGTGWQPVFPLSLALAGFRNTYTLDIYPHLRPAAVLRTLRALRPVLDHPIFQPFATPDQVRARYEALVRSSNILEAAGITYMAPSDARSTGLAPESLDLIVSNNVFEHIPPEILLDLFVEARRLLRPGGHILHAINCGDHYAYSDSSITQLNYLSFSDAEWRRWNNSIQYQNRLRPIDFLDMADHRGFEIVVAEYHTRPESLKQLEHMVIAPEFQHYAPEQLAATSITMVASS